MLHPIIQLFQQRAALLDIEKSNEGLDDSIANLASWMSMARKHLNEDDFLVVAEIGGPAVPGGNKAAPDSRSASVRNRSRAISCCLRSFQLPGGSARGRLQFVA